ncbi:hypothetical protein EC991_002759 [Linnemannia zychae]|nr:hypothetical protein EC991_002759 [Linnemannia zychae]
MSVPLYTYPCITPSATGDLLLLGISPANEGTLNIHKIDVSNINTPVATPYASQTNTLEWTSSAPTACFPYPGSSPSVAFFAQFGPLTRFANIRGANSIEGAINFPSTAFQSPKQFSFVGSTGSFDFFHVYTNKTFATTGSAWLGARFNATNSLYSFQSYYTTQIPAGLPMLSLGTYTPGSTAGYNIFFDNYGAGTIYTTSLNTQPVLATLDINLVTLAKGQDVDMGGVKLSKSAIPVTMNNIGYILDKATDGSTVVYSINPSQSAKLRAISASSDVPAFSTVQSATAVGSKIVVYGVSNSSSVFFNSFDTSAGTWTGPNLIKTVNPPTGNGGSGGGGSNTGAIIGGIVGGIVVIALIAFFVIRKRRNGGKPVTVPAPTTNYQDPGKFGNDAVPLGVPPTQQVYPLPQHQQQQQQEVYHQQYQHQQPVYDPHQGQLPPTSHYQMPQPNPAIYQQQQQYDPNLSQQQHYDPNLIQQQQQPYTYTPPTFVPQDQQQQHQATTPVIFQPQSTSGSSPTYTQAAYSPSNTVTNASEYPQTPVTSSSQVPLQTSEYQPLPQQQQYSMSQITHTVSAPVPSNPQYIEPLATTTSVNPPSNPQFIPQSGNEYAS